MSPTVHFVKLREACYSRVILQVATASVLIKFEISGHKKNYFIHKSASVFRLYTCNS